jgi:hypothetical protein
MRLLTKGSGFGVQENEEDLRSRMSKETLLEVLNPEP